MSDMQTRNSSSSPNKIYASLLVAGALLLVVGLAAFLFFEGGSPLNGWSYTTLGIAVLIAVLAIIFGIRLARGQEQHRPDYYMLFTLGIIWIGVGFALDMIPIAGMGLIFFIIGLTHKDEWKRTQWKDLSSEKKRFKIVASILLGILALTGFIAYTLFR